MRQSTRDDRTLIRDYVRERSASAFAEIVRRHRDFVYCVCLRELGDPQWAEDAAQAVFLILERRAAAILPGVPLRSWLFGVARLTAQNVRRHELRQRALAQAAALAAPAALREIAPIGDELVAALSRLRAIDRELMLRHVLDGATFEEAGQEFGISAEAARKRVGRSLLRLRRNLSHSGAYSSEAAVAAALSAFVSHAIPHHLAESTAASGSVQGTIGPVSANVHNLTQGVMQTMRIATLKSFATVAAVAVIGGGSTLSVIRSQAQGTAAARPAAVETPVSVVNRFIAARDTHDAAAMETLLLPDGDRPMSVRIEYGYHGSTTRYSDAGRAMLSFMFGSRDEAGYGFRVLGADAKDPSAVLVEAAQPGGKPALTLRIVTVRVKVEGIRIDAEESLAGADPLMKELYEAKKARNQCAANMRQILLAVIQYARDHDERVPDADRWMDEIVRYLPDRSVFRDPADRSGHRYSYAYNRSLSGKSVARMDSPAAAVLIFESTAGTRNASDTGQSLPRGGRHTGGDMIGFADGHVKWFPADRLPPF